MSINATHAMGLANFIKTVFLIQILNFVPANQVIEKIIWANVKVITFYR